MNQKRILVKAYTATNLGDDLFLKILTDRYPYVQFTLIGERRDGIYNRFKSYRLLSPLASLIRKLLLLVSRTLSTKFTNEVITSRLKHSSNDYDASLLLGGSMFIQKKHMTNDDVVKLQLLTLFNKSFVIGANFGPFTDESYLNLYKEAFSQCESISFRDRYSYELLGRLANSDYFPDVVFQLKHHRKKIVPKSVGLSVIDLTRRGNLARHSDGYLSFLISLTEHLVAQGKKVFLFSFCKQEGDEEAISHITDSIKSNLEVRSYDGNIDTFLDCYSSMEAMFCSRFHSMILSLLYSQNMVPLIYSKKMSQVLRDIEYTGSTIDLNAIETVNVDDAICMLNDNKFDLSARVRKESEGMFMKLDEFLL